MLARLDKVQGVEQSLTNYSGTMIRVTVAANADKDKVAKEVLKILTEEKRKPVRLAGDEFEQALRKEEWRELERVAQLSAIEFRTLTLRRIKTFAEKEKLDKEITDKLVKIAEEELQRITKLDKPFVDTSQWMARYKVFAGSMPNQAKDLLTAEQLERLKEWLKQGWWLRLKQDLNGRKKDNGQRP